MSFTVRASCPSGCELRGASVEVLSGEEVLATAEIVAVHEGVGGTEPLTLPAPSRVGTHTWTVRFLPREIDGTPHEEATLALPLETLPHDSSLAVWNVPSPLKMGDSFTVEVGGKCSLGCDLTGASVEVRTAEGEIAGMGQLGPTQPTAPRQLHRSVIELRAPAEEGVNRWMVHLDASRHELAHGPATAGFSLATTPPPEHRLTVEVLTTGSDTPVQAAEIRLGVHRAATDESGVAVLEVGGGSYELTVWKAGYEIPLTPLDIVDDVTVRIFADEIPDRSGWEDD